MIRAQEITQTVAEGIRLIDNWIKNIKSGDSRALPDSVCYAIEAMDIACEGDLPESCRDLGVAVPRLAEELRRYQARQDESMMPDSSPSGSFWAAVGMVIAGMNSTTEIVIEELETIAELRKQKVSDYQIAAHIYGKSGEGPFMLPNGIPNKQLLDKAEKDQESVLGKDWIPPWKKRSVEKRRAEMAEKMSIYKKLQDGPKQYSDPGSVTDMLNDGCYIQQILRYKPGTTREEVIATALSLGITPKDAPGATVQKTVQAEMDEMSAQATPAMTAESESQKASEPSRPAREGMSDSEKQMVIAFHEGNPSLGVPELVDLLREDGIVASAKQVATVISWHKRKSA